MTLFDKFNNQSLEFALIEDFCKQPLIADGFETFYWDDRNSRAGGRESRLARNVVVGAPQ